ncbi:hypothetical protein MaudCBS49596_003000 [Microsporum audouinii]
MSPGEAFHSSRASMSDDELEFYRDAPEFPDEIDDFIQRPLSSRSVVRTPSSKYRDKTVIKKREDVPHQPQLPEEGVNEADHTQPSSNAELNGGNDAVNPSKQKELADQRSISSEICVSPSWSRAGDKKRRKKDQKRQEKEQRDLERKLERESRKHANGAAQREPRRLTKRPPPASSSRASSANGRGQRPSTASSFMSFWSNRSSRASSVQGSDTEGHKTVHFLDSFKGDPKNGTWFPRMWPKKSKTKQSRHKNYLSDSEAPSENAPKRSLHTVKKHGDLRSMARTLDKAHIEGQDMAATDLDRNLDQNVEIPSEPDGGHINSSKDTSYPQETTTLTQENQGVPPSRGVVIGPSSSKKRLPRAPLTNNPATPRPTTPSRIPLSASRNVSLKSAVAEKENHSIIRNSFDKLPVVKVPKTPVHDFDRSTENAGQTPKKEDKVSLQPRSPNISKKYNRPVESHPAAEMEIKKPRDLFEVIDHVHNNDPKTNSNAPISAQDESKICGKEVSHSNDKPVISDSPPTASSDSNRHDNKLRGTINFSRAARLRPSPLSGPPLLSPEPKDSAMGDRLVNQISVGDVVQTTSALPGQGPQPTLEPSAPTRTRRLSLDRFLRPGRARKASINETDTPPAKQAVLDSNTVVANEPHNLSKNAYEGKIHATMASAEPNGGSKRVNGDQKEENGLQKTPATDSVKLPKPRRNSIDLIHKLRPSFGKAEVKLTKKRPTSAGVPTANSSIEKASAANTRTSSASNSSLPSPGNVHPIRASFPASISTVRNTRDEGNNDYFTRPIGKPWLGSDHFPSSSSLLGFSNGSPGSSSRGGRPAHSGQRIAKMFVICCKCKFWHDMPSDAYAKLAFPTVAALKNKLTTGTVRGHKDPGEEIEAGWSAVPETSTPQSNRMDDEIARVSANMSTTSTQGKRETPNSMSNGKPSSPSAFSRFSFLNQSIIKCCWCDHRMSRTCCAGWTAVVQLRERHH